MSSDTDADALYTELAELHSPPPEENRLTAEEERVLAGFEEIARFYEQQGHAPRFGEEYDIFERLYATRLKILRDSKHWREFLKAYDKYNLLTANTASDIQAENLSDDALLAELGAEFEAESSLTKLVHVRPHEEHKPRDVPQEKAIRKPCPDFAQFKPLFIQAAADLQTGTRKAERFKTQDMGVGDFFILGGQMLYIAEKGEAIETKDSREQAQLRVIYDNGTESNMLLHSVRTALYRDKTGRSITKLDAGSLFGNVAEAGDIEGGIIYVLESLSNEANIAAQRGLLHKIGVTSADVRRRIANAAKDPTFLLAEVKIVREYRLLNMKRTALEQIIHKIFAPTRADIKLRDRFGAAVKPKEWFFVPLPAIDEAVSRIKDGTITHFHYNTAEARFVENKEAGA